MSGSGKPVLGSTPGTDTLSTVTVPGINSKPFGTLVKT